MERPKVLIVDDDKMMLKHYKSFAELCSNEYEMVVLSSVEQAETLNGRAFDVAILDGLYGKCFELIDGINAERRVILTGDNAIYEKAKSQGIETYLKGEISVNDILKNKQKDN